MKNINVGQTVSIFANLGVIAGILFLGYELRQNNAFLSAEARYNLLLNRRPVHLMVIQDANVASLLVKSRADVELSEVETEQLIWYYDLLLSSMDYDYQQYRDGLVDVTALPIGQWIRGWQADDHGFQSFWRERKGDYSPDFVKFIEENIVNR